MPPDVSNQARYYELQGSLSRTPKVEAEEPEADQGRRRGGQGLPVWLRVTLIVVAVLLVALGIAGLFLPGLQGILTLLLALALLSLVSRRTHGALRWLLQPWPNLRKRVERYRRRSRQWLHRKVGNDRPSRRDGGDGDDLL
jgi:hypothetical protein